jgi:hypothetical protein
MLLYHTRHYTKHGCDIQGKLFVVEYSTDMVNDGAQYSAKYIDKAKKLIEDTKETVLSYRLTVPEVVAVILENKSKEKQ